MQAALEKAKTITDVTELANFYKDEARLHMQTLRTAADELESIVSADCWPFPTYGDLLFGV